VRSYWRNPSYNLSRFLVNIILALIFASAYVNQEYGTDVGVISRCAVMFITCLFCGALGTISAIPVALAERPVFYREQQSLMYRVIIYELVTGLVELPYIIVASGLFTMPFFFIVGFDNVWVTVEKVFWYWLFQGLYGIVMVCFGQFFVALLPTDPDAQGNLSYYTVLRTLYTCTHYVY
jgi:ABC-type multidrug transport system permease subunit